MPCMCLGLMVNIQSEVNMTETSSDFSLSTATLHNALVRNLRQNASYEHQLFEVVARHYLAGTERMRQWCHLDARIH